MYSTYLDLPDHIGVRDTRHRHQLSPDREAGGDCLERHLRVSSSHEK